MQTSKLALLIALACAGGAVVSVAPPASAAQVGLSISVGTPPPPLRYERAPPPRPGYVWAPGYWRWHHHRYAWVVGTWQRARPGYVYARPRWVHRGDRWAYQPSRWSRDPHWRHDNGRHRGFAHHDHDRDRHHGRHDRDHHDGDHDHDHDHG